jgi:hypothetical protein
MNTDASIVKPKRGRRTKKEIEAAKALQQEQQQQEQQEQKEQKEQQENIILEPNIEFKIESKEEILEGEVEDDTILTDEGAVVKASSKKRGRKPKGGKIIQQTLPSAPVKENRPNIILHLKCSLKDLVSNGDHNSNFTAANVDPYNFETSSELNYEIINSNFTDVNKIYAINETNKIENYPEEDQTSVTDDVCMEGREIWRKLKILEKDLHINNISDKKSACFWCSHDFDNPPVFIPKHFIKDTYNVYGCFCTPECAVAHLMEENIDSSTKFERYYLINHIYSKIYEYKKNIKPAPNPHYMLDKYYGNLTIQEYRSLLRSERLFLIVDKPLTRILPEFHEDNDEFIINNKIIPSNNYQVKKRLQKKVPQTKSNILNEKFGIQNVIAPVH